MNVGAGRGWLRVACEAALIVGSILMALALDAWWDGVQQDRRRRELVQELLLDFETTQASMATAIVRGESLMANMNAYFRDAVTQDPTPVDSIKVWVNAAFSPLDFEPALSSYQGAMVSGDLRLVQSRELVEAFAELELALQGFEERSRVWIEWYYLGSTAALRREVGSVQVVASRGGANSNELPPSFVLSDDAYRRLIRSRQVYGLVEESFNFRSVLVNRLRAADQAATRVVRELSSLEDR
jgi:hypothetical protein